jgi:pyruvate/2-oxoglutarate dehydrogenase complex dihydrolipoamide acyltransferase (E2) component
MKPDDMVGGTFTISTRMFDVTTSSPSSARQTAIWRHVGQADARGAEGSRVRMKATISADHRVTDGAEAPVHRCSPLSNHCGWFVDRVGAKYLI